MSIRFTRPKRYDREMFYMLGDHRYRVFVNIRRCEACYGQRVFIRRCSVCGRFLPSDPGLYFEIVRQTVIKLVKPPK